MSNNSNWMKDSVESSIQTAIQSQTIQTALERNLSDLSPQALQSFLTNAPIPRFYYNVIPTSFTGGSVTTTSTYTSNAASFDPYSMVAAGTGVITIPIDGFYSITWVLSGTAPAAGGNVFYAQITDSSATAVYGIQSVSTLAGIGVLLEVHALIPFRANSTVKVNVTNGSATAITAGAGALSGVWNAPYNQYQGGQN